MWGLGETRCSSDLGRVGNSEMRWLKRRARSRATSHPNDVTGGSLLHHDTLGSLRKVTDTEISFPSGRR